MASIDLAKLVVKLEAQTAQYDAKLQQANHQLAKFNKSAEVTGKQIAGMMVKAAAAAATAFAALAKHSIDAAEETQHMADKFGVGTKELSSLGYAAQQENLPIEALAKGMKKLAVEQQAANTGMVLSKAAFSSLNISITDSSGKLKSQTDLILEMADAFHDSEDGAGKIAVATQLLGRAGAEAIPFLNQGSKAIKEQQERAIELGIAFDEHTGRAAHEFNSKMFELGAVTSAVARDLVVDMIPALIEMMDSFQNAAREGGGLHAVIAGLQWVFKVALTGIEGFSAGLGATGRDLGAFAASANALIHGNLSEAGDILRMRAAERVKESEDVDAAITKIWSDLPAKVADAAEAADGRLKKTILFDSGGAGATAGKALATAVKKLEDLSIAATQSVQTFGLADTALIKYRLTVGDLADEVARAGKGGEKFVENIIAQTEALQRLNDANALSGIDQEILTLTGHTEEAALAAFDLQQKMLRASLTETNDTAGLAALDRLRELTAAQAAYSAEEVKAAKVRERLAITEERIQHSQETGAINEFEAMAQLDEARGKSVKELEAILTVQRKIADESGNVALIDGAEEAAAALEELSRQADLVAEHMERIFQDAGAGAFSSFLDGTETAKDAFSSFLDSLRSQIADFVAEDLMRRLFGSMLTGSGGGGGGWLSAAGAVLGIASGAPAAGAPAAAGAGGFVGPPAPPRDSGGHGVSGVGYLIGTGAQPELFVPKQAGTFYPKGKYRDSGRTAARGQDQAGTPRNRGGGGETVPAEAGWPVDGLDAMAVGYRRGGLPMPPASLQAVAGGQAGAAGSDGLPGGQAARSVSQMISRLSQVSASSNRTTHVSAISKIGASVSRALMQSQSRDSGGRGAPGERYMVGVSAQPEAFIPDTVGTMGHNPGTSGTKITNHFTIQASGGQISRKTETQIAAAAARGISQANRRGN